MLSASLNNTFPSFLPESNEGACFSRSRLIPYGCLSTGKSVGLIEIVKNAKTITSIQKEGGSRATIQMDSSQLHRWIKENNQNKYGSQTTSGPDLGQFGWLFDTPHPTPALANVEVHFFSFLKCLFNVWVRISLSRP